MKLVAHRVDVRDQVLVLLDSAVEITGLVNQPANHRVGTELHAQLFGSNSRGMDEVCPPMVVWLGFVLLPLMKRWPSNQDNVLALLRPGTRRGDDGKEEKD